MVGQVVLLVSIGLLSGKNLNKLIIYANIKFNRRNSCGKFIYSCLQFTSISRPTNRGSYWGAPSTNFKAFDNNPSFSTTIKPFFVVGTVGRFFIGVGSVAPTINFIDYTPSHFGFKIEADAGSMTIRGTVSNGATNSQTAVLTTVAAPSSIDLAAVKTGVASVEFFYSVDAGAWQSATLTTNVPGFSTNDRIMKSVIFNGSAVDFTMIIGNYNYER
jgi:hypothetical protein